MRKKFSLVVITCFAIAQNFCFSQNTIPAEEPIDSIQNTTVISSENDDSSQLDGKTDEKLTTELLMELLEKSKQERVGYFQTKQDLSIPFKVHIDKDTNFKKRESLREIVESLENKLTVNKTIYSKLAKNQKTGKDSLELFALLKTIIQDSVQLISEKAKLKSIEIPEVLIDTVRVYIYNARINRIIFTLKNDNGYFGNQVPISVTNFEKRLEDKLHYKGSNPLLNETYLELGDVLNYICLTERIAYPPDTIVKISGKNQIAQIVNNGKQLQYFDVRVYTDTKGLSGESNGLIQTEINTSFYGNTRNQKNCSLTWLPYVRLNLGLSKFDSKFDTLQLNTLTSRVGTDYLKLTQYSNINLRFEVDLVRYSRIHDAYITLGHQMQSTVVQDTSGNSQRIFSPSFYTVLGGTMFNYPRMKCEFKLPFFIAYLMDQPFKDYMRKVDFMIMPEIEITFDPIKIPGQTEVSGTRIFGRVRYFDMTDFRGGNFWQLQLGAQISLSEILKK